eukprot:3201344-Rhodomonas_salina.2
MMNGTGATKKPEEEHRQGREQKREGASTGRGICFTSVASRMAFWSSVPPLMPEESCCSHDDHVVRPGKGRRHPVSQKHVGS